MTPEITALASAARMTLPKVRELLGAGPDDLAENVALVKAAGVVAVDLLRRSEEPVTEARTEYLSRVLMETLGRTDRVSLQRAEPSTGFRSRLIVSFTEALEPLDEAGVGFREVGVDVAADEVAVIFVDALTDNLLAWGGKSALLRDVALQLQIDRVTESLLSGREGSPPLPVVRAWITVEEVPPRILVFNDGASPIFNVIPTPALAALDLDGQAGAMLGGGPLWGIAASQISPDHGYCWPLEHMTSWGGQSLVISHLSLEFTDNAGRRWRLVHDRLTELT